MKLYFEPDLDFQVQAINSVCNLFRGQKICRPEFTVLKSTTHQASLGFGGISNQLTLSNEALLKNLRSVQFDNGLSMSDTLDSLDFTVEMETGTGKTYVYLRTIFEMNKLYGFTKFVIVVPTIAIKEGVYKSLQITEEHFRALYSGIPFDYFLYDSAKLGQVWNFATDMQITIMVVTVGSINKRSINNLYKESEKTGGEKPIDLIRATRPVLIVDEPQSVDGGLVGRGREALREMHPLCTLRYSATHVDKYHMIYRLDAVDAYERKLVKQIEVASATVEDAHNKPYIRLVSTNTHQGNISAQVELDIRMSSKIQRRKTRVYDGDNLELITDRAVYRDCYIGEIRIGNDGGMVEVRVPGGEDYLQIGQAYGDVDVVSVQRQMIRRTIREHLDKEKRLRPQGIKVLSLFFVDAVDRYRRYDENGNSIKGECALIFEEEYRRYMRHPDYKTLFENSDQTIAVDKVHDGYFSIDKKGRWTNTAENNQINRTNAGRAYNLIMKDKERLLSLNNPLKFIFSHSALREGWDNPNVFQVCVLRDIRTDRGRRQTIGRGLRLCVNQEGKRLRGFDINTLTVIAMESYEQFAENLQREIEDEQGIRFGVVEVHGFADIPVIEESGQTTTLGVKASEYIWEYLRTEKYIDSQGRISNLLKQVLVDDAFTLPVRYKNQKEEIVRLLRKITGYFQIKRADERRVIRPRQAILYSPEFKDLWDRIKHKTTYRVSFDNNLLIERIIQEIREAPPIAKTRLQWRKADIAINRSGVEPSETTGAATVVLNETNFELPDVLTELQDRTKLTRKSIQLILCQSKRLTDFKQNPQRYIEFVERAIKRCKQDVLIDGIKYQRLGDEYYYAQELFESRELTGYLKNMLDTTKSVYEQVVYESSVEASFADQLETNTAVKVYAKLPGWFTVPTPLGTYNPDWAVLINSDEGERLYFVVETKGTLDTANLRYMESAKIKCGKEHFNAIKVEESSVKYQVTTTVDGLLSTL